jgi:Xaa-Pro aminopeptidase
MGKVAVSGIDGGISFQSLVICDPSACGPHYMWKEEVLEREGRKMKMRYYRWY